MLNSWIALAMLAAAMPADADVYQLVYFEHSGANLIDRTTISRSGEIVEYQHVFVFYKPIIGPGGENSYAVGRDRVDCQNNRIEFFDSTGFDNNGKIAYGVPILPAWENIVPGTKYEALERAVCRSVIPKDILFRGDLHTVIMAVRAYLTKKH